MDFYEPFQKRIQSMIYHRILKSFLFRFILFQEKKNMKKIIGRAVANIGFIFPEKLYFNVQSNFFH